MKVLLTIIALLSSIVVNGQSNSDLYQASHSNISTQTTSGKLALNDEKEETYAITITVTHIRNTKGVIRFKFYDDSTPFPDDLGFLRVVIPKTEMTGDSLRVTYSGFTSKNMAIALLDDENDNWELDMGWFLPKEGHAFSDYYHSALRRPVYEDFSFMLEGDKKVKMKMKYY
ncbi:MAG: DUF2141 domain-containing protein [Cyclobacteriaceae bacterium]|jgi:uncharacterized protein (DUF2141 family)|nr:DUF2141 domain-containing protein [Cyclobacteriaceae bacterium]